MGKKDKRVDNYIAKAQPFAKPILKKLRVLIHRGNPDVEETIKWVCHPLIIKDPSAALPVLNITQFLVFGNINYLRIRKDI